jgi:hypothetical protein
METCKTCKWSTERNLDSGTFYRCALSRGGSCIGMRPLFDETHTCKYFSEKVKTEEVKNANM